MVLEKQSWKVCKPRVWYVQWGAMGHPQAYGVDHYLNESLFDSPSFPVKKTSPQNSFPFLFCGGDISGHKDNMQAAIKPPNKIWCKVSREYIKLPTFNKCQKTQKESSWNLKEWIKQQKTESVQKNSSSITNFFGPLKHVRKI